MIGWERLAVSLDRANQGAVETTTTATYTFYGVLLLIFLRPCLLRNSVTGSADHPGRSLLSWLPQLHLTFEMYLDLSLNPPCGPNPLGPLVR